MPRRNVYLPDDLDRYARTAGLSLSRLLQEAIKAEQSKPRTPVKKAGKTVIPLRVKQIDLEDRLDIFAVLLQEGRVPPK